MLCKYYFIYSLKPNEIGAIIILIKLRRYCDSKILSSLPEFKQLLNVIYELTLFWFSISYSLYHKTAPHKGRNKTYDFWLGNKMVSCWSKSTSHWRKNYILGARVRVNCLQLDILQGSVNRKSNRLLYNKTICTFKF